MPGVRQRFHLMVVRLVLEVQVPRWGVGELHAAINTIKGL
jgi:hypothetical protein